MAIEREVSIVIPTRGRDTLERCLDSLRPINQGGYGAIITVVIDTFELPKSDIERIKSICKNMYHDAIEYNAGYSDWGYPQLQYAYQQMIGNKYCDYICNIGDDDVFVDGVLPKIVKILSSKPLGLFMFQAELYPSPHRGNKVPVTLWNDSSRDIERKKITGQNLFVPMIPQFMGSWTDDFSFMKETIELWHNKITWVPMITCRCY